MARMKVPIRGEGRVGIMGHYSAMRRRGRAGAFIVYGVPRRADGLAPVPLERLSTADDPACFHMRGPCPCRLADVRDGGARRLLRDVQQRQPRLRHSHAGNVRAVGDRRRRHLPAGFHQRHPAELRATAARRLAVGAARCTAATRRRLVCAAAAGTDLALRVAVGRYLLVQLPALNLAALPPCLSYTVPKAHRPGRRPA